MIIHFFRVSEIVAKNNAVISDNGNARSNAWEYLCQASRREDLVGIDNSGCGNLQGPGLIQ